jgi:acetyl-CoA decarbonylase/synthase complex subunit gamma
MPVKASELQKLLPENGKKNCKECGLATCFAFAMKLANAGIALDKCTHLPAASRAQIEDMLQAPIRLVTVGVPPHQVTIGEEEVMYRHQKSFLRQPALALRIVSAASRERWAEQLAKFSWQYTRLDKVSRLDLVVLSCDCQDRARYLELVRRALAETDAALVLDAGCPGCVIEAYQLAQDRNPLVCVSAKNWQAVVPQLRPGTPVCARASSLEELAELTAKLKQAGVENLVLDPRSKNLEELVRHQTLARRAALLHKFRPLGYPTLFSTPDASPGTQLLLAVGAVAKYAGIIVLDDISREAFETLCTVRQDLYTDPRVAPTVESKVYAFNDADESAAVLVTTNFALTYYAVAGETENSKLPAYLICQDTGGLCVLAAWSTGKFVPETIAEMVKKQAVADKVKHKQLVLPGYVARIKGELEEELPGWEIIVGPREAADLPKFLHELRRRRATA